MRALIEDLLSAAEVNKIIAENPLKRLATDPSRHLLGFTQHAQALEPFKYC